MGNKNLEFSLAEYYSSKYIGVIGYIIIGLALFSTISYIISETVSAFDIIYNLIFSIMSAFPLVYRKHEENIAGNIEKAKKYIKYIAYPTIFINLILFLIPCFIHLDIMNILLQITSYRILKEIWIVSAVSLYICFGVYFLNVYLKYKEFDKTKKNIIIAILIMLITIPLLIWMFGILLDIAVGTPEYANPSMLKH